MNIGVVGLGLIGGSLAGAIKQNTNHSVYGYDINNDVVNKAMQSGFVDFQLNDDNLNKCDIVIIAVYPADTVNYVLSRLKYFKENSYIVDCCGTKRTVCEKIWNGITNSNITFVGGHPMAGKHFSGFEYASATLFKGASMILVPSHTEIKLEILEHLFLNIGFTVIKTTTVAEHDRIIAFSSQLAHVVSNCYIKSPQAGLHSGFSAGSYKDMTRVAFLNSKMWTELFLDNADNISNEIDILIKNLEDINNAIKHKDAETLYSLLEEGSEIKKKVDM